MVRRGISRAVIVIAILSRTFHIEHCDIDNKLHYHASLCQKCRDIVARRRRSVETGIARSVNCRQVGPYHRTFV